MINNDDINYLILEGILNGNGDDYIPSEEVEVLDATVLIQMNMSSSSSSSSSFLSSLLVNNMLDNKNLNVTQPSSLSSMSGSTSTSMSSPNKNIMKGFIKQKPFRSPASSLTTSTIPCT